MHIFPGRYHAWQNSLPHFVWHCEIILVGCFQATAGEAQEADYESESQSLLWAFPSALGRKQVFQEYCLLLWPASRRTLAVSCLPAIYCLFILCNTRWSFCLYLWNKSVHFIGEVETLYFYWDLYLLFVARKKKKRKEKKRKKKKTLSLLQRNCNVLRHSGWKPHGKMSKGKWWRKMGNTESHHWHNASWKRVRCGQLRHVIGRACSVMRGKQSSYGPGHLLVQCRLSDNVPHQLATNISWVVSTACG